MADVIQFPKTVQDATQDFRARHQNGNGAREAVMAIAGYSPENGDEALRTDCFLADLWTRGFKVVPIED